MAQHINSIIDIWLEQESLPEQDKPTVSLNELLYLVDHDGGSNRDVVFTVEQVAAYLAVYGPLAKVVQLFGKATASYAVIKDTLVSGRMPVVVDAGSSGNVSSMRYYLPDISSIDLRTPSQNAGAFKFYNVDTGGKKVRILIYAEGAESPSETELSLDYSGGLVTRRVGSQSSTTDLVDGFFLDAPTLCCQNSITIEAPTLSAGEEYDYVVVFDTFTNSNLVGNIDVENCKKAGHMDNGVFVVDSMYLSSANPHYVPMIVVMGNVASSKWYERT